MGKLWKPVISPINKLVEIKNSDPIKKRKKFKFHSPDVEVPTASNNIEDLLTEDESEQEMPLNVPISDYLQMILHNDEKIDQKLGIRYTNGNKPMIGNNDVKFHDNTIEIGKNQYPRTSGLLEFYEKTG